MIIFNEYRGDIIITRSCAYRFGKIGIAGIADVVEYHCRRKDMPALVVVNSWQVRQWSIRREAKSMNETRYNSLAQACA
jgi:hypothetical protein